MYHVLNHVSMISWLFLVNKDFLKLLKRDYMSWPEAIASDSRWRRVANEENTENLSGGYT